MNIIMVRFKSGTKNYAYYTKDLSINEGDSVVVDSPYDGYTVCVVREVNPVSEDSLSVEKPIVCKVNDTEYKKELEKDIRVKQLEKQLEKLAEKQEKLVKFNFLYNTEEGKKLLDELKNLQTK